MALAQLVNATPVSAVSAVEPDPAKNPPAGGAGALPATPPANAGGAVSTFMTPQSIVTFSGASTVVSVLWNIGQKICKWNDTTTLIAGFLISIGIGALIYFISMSDDDLAKPKPKALVIGIAIAFVNSMFLFAGAVGLSTLKAGTSAPVAQQLSAPNQPVLANQPVKKNND